MHENPFLFFLSEFSRYLCASLFVLDMIRNIIFDLGAVILDLAPERCKETFRRMGLTQIDQLLSTAHQQGIIGQLEQGHVSAESFCDGVRQLIQPGFPSPDNRAILRAFCSMADGIPYERMDKVAELKRRGYHVSVLSNTNAVHWNYCSRYFVECGYVTSELFEYVWLSHELHLAKPDPEIFREVLRQSGYIPGETLFVDDNASNCQSAEALGIHTLCPAPRSDWRDSLESLLAK